MSNLVHFNITAEADDDARPLIHVITISGSGESVSFASTFLSQAYREAYDKYIKPYWFRDEPIPSDPEEAFALYFEDNVDEGAEVTTAGLTW